MIGKLIIFQSENTSVKNIYICFIKVCNAFHHYFIRDYNRSPGPAGEIKFSQCTMYSDNHNIIKCNAGWEYDTHEYDSTISSAFNWVCDQQSNPTDAFTYQALGNAVITRIINIIYVLIMMTFFYKRLGH